MRMGAVGVVVIVLMFMLKFMVLINGQLSKRLASIS